MRIETVIRKDHEMTAHRVVAVREVPGGLEAEIERRRNGRLACGRCRRPAQGIYDRGKARRWRTRDVIGRALWLIYRPFRVLCRACGIRVEAVPWAARFQRVTRLLARQILAFTREVSWRVAAKWLGLNWKTIAATIRWAVAEGLQHRRLKPLRILGIDEVSRQKGHSYFSLFYDLERRELLWVSEGRKEEAVALFFAWLGPHRARALQAVVLDMWAPYRRVVEQEAPQAVIVFDRFHLVRHLNAAVDQVRRAMVRELEGADRRALKGTRYLWLSNPWALSDGRRTKLSELLRVNLPIVRAYLLKEAFQQFFEYRSVAWATKWLRNWFHWATHSRLAPLRRFAWLVRRHEQGILAWIELRISNGPLEGLNTKIKAVARRAYGFRNPVNHIAAIFHACGNLPDPLPTTLG
jgi:transposase